jgi:16S rRNA (guanine966-N2)-methyltransferase
MSIVQTELPGARVLDLFAGSGALGLEARSRGASVVDLVEVNTSSLGTIRENIELLGAGPEVKVHRADAVRFIADLPPLSYDVAFADPPYGHGLAAQIATRWLSSPFAAVLGVEHDVRDVMPPGGEQRRYGTTCITFYRESAALDSRLPIPDSR